MFRLATLAIAAAAASAVNLKKQEYYDPYKGRNPNHAGEVRSQEQLQEDYVASNILKVKGIMHIVDHVDAIGQEVGLGPIDWSTLCAGELVDYGHGQIGCEVDGRDVGL